MYSEFKNKTVVISGSSAGLGLATAEKFLSYGARVTITGRSKEKIDASVSILKDKYDENNILDFAGDLTDPIDVNKLIHAVIEQYSRIDVVIANLGSGSGDQEWDVSEEEWGRMFDLNFNSGRYLVKAAVPEMNRNNEGGRIIFVSSIAAMEDIGAPVSYCVAKSALNTYSKLLARRLANSGILVNTICPGNLLLPGGSWEQKVKKDPEKINAYIKDQVPLSRFADGDDITNTIVFMSSSHSSFTTGSIIVADGGQSKCL